MKEIEKWIIYISKRIERKYFWFLFLTMIGGLFVHNYCFTNNLLTHDSLYNFYADQNMVTSGRWFLGLSCAFSSYFDLHWLNGIMSLFWLAMSGCVVINIYKIYSKFAIFLISMLLVSFPSVASTFAYMYTADGYFLGFFLSCLAVYFLVQRHWKKNVLGVICITLSMGIYQAYLSVTIVLLMIYLIICMLKQQKVHNDVVRFLISGICACAMYFIILKVCLLLTGVTLTDYQGINTVSQTKDISFFLMAIYKCYREFAVEIWFGVSAEMNVFHIVSCFLTVICTIGMILGEKIEIKKVIGILFLLALLPCAIYIMYFTSPDVAYHDLMTMSWAMVWMIPVIIAYSLKTDTKQQVILQGICVCVILGNIITNIVVDNIAYTSLQTAYERSYALTGRVYERVEKLEAEYDTNKLCVVGCPDSNIYMDSNIKRAVGSMQGIRNGIIFHEAKHVVLMMNQYFGRNYEYISYDSLENKIDIAETWPLEKSVFYEDGLIYVVFE